MLAHCRAAFLLLLGALALSMGAPARAAPAQVLPVTTEGLTFAIASGPLNRVLLQFARQAGIDLTFDSGELERIQSEGLRGRYTIRDGLSALLSDTGLEAVVLRDGGYAIRRQRSSADHNGVVPTLPSVIVTGAAVRSGLATTSPDEPFAHSSHLGLLGDTDVMDAPVSVRSYTSRFVQDVQARSIADVIENDASVRSVSKPGGILDAFTIRGFPFSNGNFGEIAFDGVYGVASNYRLATGYIERIDLVKGPAAVLTGMAPGGSVGGGINIVPKRAGDADTAEFTADYASTSQLGGAMDVSRRFGSGKEFGVRFNGGYRAGDTALDNQSRNAGFGALAMDYRGSQLRATFDAVGQRESIAAPSRLLHIVPGIEVPAAPDGHRNISQPWESSRIDDASMLFRATYDVNDHLQWFAYAGGGRTQVARLFAIAPTIINEAGDVSVFDTNYRFDVARASAEAGARSTFSTGPVDHRLTLAISGYRDQLDRGLVNSPVTSLTNLYSPVALPPQSIAAPADVPTVSRTRLSGLAVVDTASMFDHRLQATLGLRYQRIRSDNYSVDATAEHYDASAISPMVGIVGKPADGVTLYANRLEGLSKGDTAPAAASNAGETFAPYRSTQYELGVKLAHRGMIATLAAFQIKKPSGQISGSRFTADAEQRNRGLEFGLYGEVVPGIRLNASAMWLDAAITRSYTVLGKVPVGVPSWQANLNAELDMSWLPGLTISGSMFYTGSQYVDGANTQRVPAWTRFDLGVRYRATGRYPASYRLTVQNILNRRGWAAVDAYGGLAVADPRTVLASVTLGF